VNNTESTCEVVKVVSIEKHPNADRLEIAKFAFKDGTVPDYQVVVGRGDFSTDDLAVYISDDMLVPVAHPAFEFLKDKAKGGYHRVRACRLRGQMSTGFLIKLQTERYGLIDCKLGKDVAEYLGVLKYVSPLEQSAHASSANTPQKKLGLISRIVYSVIRKLYTPVKVPEYSVLSLRKVPDLFKDCEAVILTEKIHGSQIRFGRVNGHVYIGSHHTEKSDSRNWLVRFLTGARRKGPGYYGTDVWSSWFKRVFNSKDRLSELPNNVIFYGELFGPGIQPWTYGLTETQVMVFDAYDVKNNQWLNWMDIGGALPHFIDMVPVVSWGWEFDRADLKELVENTTTAVKNHFTTDPKHKCNDIEGVVARSDDWKRAGKLVSDKYLESVH
jgi:tRNA-binding EMAP/Myf-like protein